MGHKGYYGEYTGNARHSRKEEMIHDRELIHDAKAQLHEADKDYKHDSPFERSYSIDDSIGSDLQLPETTSENSATGKQSIVSIGSDKLPDISQAAGGIGTFKEMFPSSPSQPSSTSTSRSSYVPIGEARRERRLGKAERKADLKRSQKKHIAANRLEKKASRIKDRAYVKGDAGSYNQWSPTSPDKTKPSPLENSGLGPKKAGSGLYMRACGHKK